MLKALEESPWDLVISDYSMPTLTGIEALKVFKGSGLEIPFILVSGTIGEDAAVEAMKEGAHDYLMKDRLERLVPAIERELREANNRRKQRSETEIREKLQDQLRQSQKMEAIGTLAGGIAHDFNNILSAAIGFTEMALTDVKKGSRVATCLEQIMIAQQRAADLINQILTFSRKSDNESKPVWIQEVIQEALSLLRSTLPSTIEIHQHIDPDCGPVLADPTQLLQIIMNLSTNSYHAMREQGGILDIRLTPLVVSDEAPPENIDLQQGTYAQISILDTGTGMNDDTVQRIFEPYFTTKERGEGTGLGLAMVHGIVQDHGGTIQIDSRPDEGTTFHIFLPLLDINKGIEQDEDLHENLKGSERILFVDDEDQILRFAKIALEKLGYDVRIYANSMEALNAFEDNPTGFDVVVTDQTMPFLTGAELAKRMLEVRPDLPIVLCTGYSDLLSEEKALELGVMDYITKPIMIKDLAGAIRKVLKQASRANT